MTPKLNNPRFSFEATPNRGHRPRLRGGLDNTPARPQQPRRQTPALQAEPRRNVYSDAARRLEAIVVDLMNRNGWTRCRAVAEAIKLRPRLHYLAMRHQAAKVGPQR